MGEPVYEIYAIRYAHRVGKRSDMFLDLVERPDEPLAMDYFVWLAVCPERTVVIDTGFTAETALRMKRDYIASPVDTLRRFGIDPGAVRDVILTHLHYDHAGNVQSFPEARYLVQNDELAYWTSPLAGRASHNGDPSDYVYLVRAAYQHRVRGISGDADIMPGISVHLVRGHTPGMQVVRVNTARGIVVLASDSSHYYENIEKDRPFRTLHTVPLVYAAFDRVRELAGPDGLILPGHDPLVTDRFPAASAEFRDLVYRIA